MKKILILAYDFPPYNSVGSQRPHSWFKNFPNYDVHPIVVSRNWEGISYGSVDAFSKQTHQKVVSEINENSTLYYVPYKPNVRDRLLLKKGLFNLILRKLLTVMYRFMSFFSLKFDNRSAIYFQAKEILKKQPEIEYIIATGEPFILFKYAHLLSKEYRIPWHADYRDDWINNHTETVKGGIQLFLLKIDRLFEKKYLSNVSSFTSVSDFLVNDIKKRTGLKNGFVLENGVDLNLLKEIKYKKSNKFLITYTGIMYDFGYMEAFYEGFNMFLKEKNFDDRIQLRFVGIQNIFNQAVEKALLLKETFPNHVEILERVPIAEALKLQLESTILLNLIAGDPSKGLVGAKCYSYAATKNPILSVSLIDNKNSFFFPNRNIHTVAYTKEEINNFLCNYFEHYLNGIEIKTDISEDEIFKLSREYNSKKLLLILEKNNVQY